jgi:hypothetical protein
MRGNSMEAPIDGPHSHQAVLGDMAADCRRGPWAGGGARRGAKARAMTLGHLHELIEDVFSSKAQADQRCGGLLHPLLHAQHHRMDAW